MVSFACGGDKFDTYAGPSQGGAPSQEGGAGGSEDASGGSGGGLGSGGSDSSGGTGGTQEPPELQIEESCSLANAADAGAFCEDLNYIECEKEIVPARANNCYPAFDIPGGASEEWCCEEEAIYSE